MPKIEIDYANTIIYKIVCNDLNIPECYVGHTTNFVQRRNQHKSSCVNEKDKRHNLKLYSTISANGGWENYSMIELEKYPCNDANEARTKEREYYEKLNSSLNSVKPYRGHAEWCFDNKEKCSAYNQEYREIHKEKISAYNQEYREINKEKYSAYYQEHKEKIAAHKQEHYEINKEKIAAHSKEYRAINKERISVKNKKKIVCECGKEILYCCKARHFKTKVHNDFFLVK